MYLTTGNLIMLLNLWFVSKWSQGLYHNPWHADCTCELATAAQLLFQSNYYLPWKEN